MKKIQHILFGLILLLGTAGTVCAQFFQQSSLYMDNLYLINAAAIGEYEFLRSSFSHRNQWNGIEGAPRSNAYTISTPFSDKIYLGGVFLNDKEDLIERTSGVLTYAYQLQIDAEQVVVFGLSGGVGQTKLNVQNARVEDYTDNVLSIGNFNATTFTTNFGLYYKYRNVRGGLSFPNFASINTGQGEFGESGVGGLKESPMVHASYKFDNISEDINLTPMGIYRFAPAGRSQFDISLRADYQNRFWAGVMLRQYAGFIAQAGANITDQLQVGYSYEFPTNGIARNSSGTHEFIISLNLRKLTASLNKEDFKSKRKYMAAVAPQDSSLIGPPLPPYLGGDKEKVSVAEAIKQYRKEQADKETLGTFKEVNSSGKLGVVAKRGYYVVLASHRTKSLALKRANDFRAQGLNVKVILNDRKSWYLVTGVFTVNKEQAIIQALNFRKKGYKGAWVFINK